MTIIINFVKSTSCAPRNMEKSTIWKKSSPPRLTPVKGSFLKKSITHPSRHDQVVVPRIILDHAKLTHRYLLNIEEPPTCKSCNTSLTVQRVVTHWKKYFRGRQHSVKSPLGRILKKAEITQNLLHYLKQIPNLWSLITRTVVDTALNNEQKETHEGNEE